MVIKYGAPIGHAVTSIKKRHVGSHSQCQDKFRGKASSILIIPFRQRKWMLETEAVFFEGYKRADGSVGTRNEIWIIPTVSCVNTTANTLAKLAQELYPDSCDGIFAYPHNAGCSQLGEDFEITQKILASIVHHPNAGGVLLSLGCENNDFEHFIPVLGDYDPKRIKFWLLKM